MNAGERTVRLVGLSLPKRSRARFVEEWRSDLASARSVGLSERQIVFAVIRVAGFLLAVRLQAAIHRQRSRLRVLLYGVLLGFVFTIVAFPVDVLVPFVVLAVGWGAVAGVRAWVNGAA